MGGAEEPGAPWDVRSYALSLSHGVGPDRHLRAACTACERRVVFDPAPWVDQGLAGLPLTAFEARLRCVCGARRARLEIWPGPPSPGPPEVSIYAFR
jgi:hypothetical protein